MTYSRISLAAGAALGMAILAGGAQAQQFKGYTFEQQNRASLAVAMKQMEDGGSSSLGGTVGGSGTTIVCGGGSATATANNTCIIMNNSTGEVVTDQVSEGDQTASNSDQITMNGEPISGADEVLTTLTE